jgi:hypothetical protein
MAEVVDDLLLLAPEREPPAGFESSVIAMLAAAGPRRAYRGDLLTGQGSELAPCVPGRG